MNTLLPVLAYCASDHSQAERVLDLIALYRNRRPEGYLLLVAAPDTHPEMHKQMEIAAHIGFERVGQLVVPKPKELLKTKAQGINHLFQAAAVHIGSHYKSAFLWLEPDSVPLKSSWLEDLSAAYHAQHKLYMGPVLTKPPLKIIGRVAVYPSYVGKDMLLHMEAANNLGTTWEYAAGESLVNRAGKTRLIQQLRYDRESTRDLVRQDAVLFHGDKEGVLLEELISDLAGRPGGVKNASPARRADPLVKEGDSKPPAIVTDNSWKTLTDHALEKTALAEVADEIE